MAIMIPEAPISFNDSPGESRIFESLQKLDDRCYVFHSLRWIGRATEKAQGEADFLIFDPTNGILVIEVKSGGIRCTQRQWFQTNLGTGREREIQDPEVQAGRSKFEIIHILLGHLNQSEYCLVCHAVWFPSISFPPHNLPMNYERPMVLDISSLENPGASIQAVFDFWKAKHKETKLSKNSIEKIMQLLAPIFHVVPHFSSDFEVRENKFIQMTNEQARIIDFLDEQRVAVITGAAGTGKTIIALEKARRQSEQGRTVAFLCFNSALRKYLKKHHPIARVDFHTFHSLASHFTGCTDSFEKSEHLFIEKLAQDDFELGYDDIVVDEGQDFDNQWLEWLHLKIGGCFYVFYDRNQLIYQPTLSNWIQNAECRLVLKRNCRNTLQINRTAHRCAGYEMILMQDNVTGHKTKIYEASTQSFVRLLAGIISNSIDQYKCQPCEIALLSMAAINDKIKEDLFKLTGVPVSEEIQENHLCVTTVRKFKGLEAKIVIITDVRLNDFKEFEYRNRLYIGCSRAKHELHILFHDVNKENVACAIASLKPGTKRTATIKTLSQILDAQWQERVL